MSEDDTFRILSRHPFQEVRLAIRSANKDGRQRGRVVKIANKMGWSLDQYLKELERVNRIEYGN